MSRKVGMNYAPTSKPRPVVAEGEFVFAAEALDQAISIGLADAGALTIPLAHRLQECQWDIMGHGK